jgi:hypothetical protein
LWLFLDQWGGKWSAAIKATSKAKDLIETAESDGDIGGKTESF